MGKKQGTYRQLMTQWGSKIKGETEPLAEYPRPTLVREHWQCLNGMWKYAFTDKDQEPEDYEGDILVPFSPETVLSGVQKQLLPGQLLWYEREVQIKEELREQLKAGGRLLLHFGAVDQSCCVFVNGQEVCTHTGGYLPFTADITEYIENGSFLLKIWVEDVTDTSYHSVGKQTLTPGGMYYPGTSGIWQTVWMEAVPQVSIRRMDWEPDFAESRIEISPKLTKTTSEESLFIKLTFLNGEYPEQRLPADATSSVSLPGFRAWSPEEPYLYQVAVSLVRQSTTGEELLDRVESYFAMRKCSIGTDETGCRRIFLNEKPYIQVGVLDQGYWPESMYTAPSEDAMIYDIQTMKDLGFNMLRKHVKVEPERWYYHCDRLGMLVWQDMVNGGRKNKGWYVTYMATVFNLLGIRAKDTHKILLSRQDAKGRREYEVEFATMMQALHNHPSIVCLVPFNEGWGQFETKKMTLLARRMNPNVIVDQASGWFDMGGGDLKSLHYYFFKFKYKRESERALALTEFGGYTRKVEGHCAHEKEYGYKTFQTKEDLEAGYEQLMREVVLPAVEGGVSATVYTQLSDVEEEINGILTYDRKVLKMDANVLRKWNEKLKIY